MNTAITTAIIDSGTGNSRSVQSALQHLGIAAPVTSTLHHLYNASVLIVPGVGHAHKVMTILNQRGIDKVITHHVAQKKPLLAICVGAQLLLEYTYEGNTTGLGLLPGRSYRFSSATEKVPHMGWNHIRYSYGEPLFGGIPQDSAFYFVHSFYTYPTCTQHQLAWCNYGVCFPAVFGANALYATQFHPEKSGGVGLTLLRNFMHIAAERLALRRSCRYTTPHTPPITHTKEDGSGTALGGAVC